MKKGQITMEALLLYGAAILVVLLAVAALVYFGVLDLGIFLPNKCNFAGTGSLSCEDYAMSSAGVLELELANKGSKTIQITAADIELKDEGLSGTCTTASTSPIPPGGSQVLTITCVDFVGEPGQKVSGKIRLTTTVGSSSIDHSMVGDFTATIG